MAAKQFTIQEIQKLIADNTVYVFYNSRYWRRLSKNVIKEQNNECQRCKERHKVSAARLVHHVNPLKLRPDLAYKRYYTDDKGTKRKQLIALCFRCHEEVEGRLIVPRKKYMNEEKW